MAVRRIFFERCMMASLGKNSLDSIYKEIESQKVQFYGERSDAESVLEIYRSISKKEVVEQECIYTAGTLHAYMG
jgi:hypothetical protein